MRAVLVQRFVDDVPTANPSLVPSHYGVDVVAHALQQGFAGERLALVVLENPARRLAMPDQAVADDEHPVLLAERDVTIGRREVEAVGARVQRFPLERVLRADAVELRRDDGVAARVALFELRLIHRHPDSEHPFIGPLQRGGLALRHRGRQNNRCDRFHLLLAPKRLTCSRCRNTGSY